MEVLFVTANLPYPATSGATIRTSNLIRRLARRHRLHLLAFGDRRNDAEALAHFEESCASVDVVHFTDTKGTPLFYLELLANLLSPTPYIVSRFTRSPMIRAIREALQDRSIDLVHCDFLTLGKNLPAGNGAPRLVTAHNVESLIWKRYLEHERNPLKAAYIWVQYRKLLRFEGRIAREFDGVACVSEEDSELFRRITPDGRYVVVPNGVDLEFFRPRPEDETPHRLVFTGSMDWRPNQDAVRFFLNKSWARVKRAEPRSSVMVVGREPPPSMLRLADEHPDVEMVGTVPDMRPYLASAAVYVVPLRIGGGTRLKILEAMAMALPVVSTSVGCEGLEVTDGEHLLIADEPDELADAVVRLLRDRELAARIAAAGLDLVQRSYGWDPIAGILEQAWTDAVERRRS